MNLIDAMNSKQFFRRPVWGNNWCTVSDKEDGVGIELFDQNGKVFGTLNHTDLLATDYEIRGPVISLDSKQFWVAANKAAANVYPYAGADGRFTKELARLLGLQEEK